MPLCGELAQGPWQSRLSLMFIYCMNSLIRLRIKPYPTLQWGHTMCHQQFPICGQGPVFPHWYVNISELLLLGLHPKVLVFETMRATYSDICDYIASGKWSSLLWTVMSYLFSWRGYREMIWRWRSGSFQPLFLGSSGTEQIAVWHQGMEGRAEYHIFPRKLQGPHWPGKEQWAACKLRSHIQTHIELQFERFRSGIPWC